MPAANFANLVLLTSLLYVALLFALAYISDRRWRSSEGGILRSPLVYTLSISVYCTSWTFYGAVGSAARSGLEFATIYLGPTLVFVGWWFLLRKLVRIGHAHRITSIADLISSRFGKSAALAVLVTVIAVVSTTPYIALQLKAVATSFQVVGNVAQTDLLGVTPETDNTAIGFWVAAAMAVFTILFGTRNLDANEHNPGVVAAIAFEALVKLIAVIGVGIFVVFGIAGGVENTFSFPPAQTLLSREEAFNSRWITLTLLSAVAIVCLPRQFQITVVENTDESHLRVASWAFPLYLFLISLFILPIAIVGLEVLPAGSNPDMFVLTLPISANQDGLALLAFIGGFSSATSMVIIASIALSIMLSNHIVLPLALKLLSLPPNAGGDIKKLLLISRRISIGVVLLLGYGYFSLSARSDALASIGLIAFAGVAQFAPALLAGLFWRQATARGAICGLTAGFVLWLYTLFLPSLKNSNVWIMDLVNQGPLEMGLLRPQALFGLEGFDPLTHALFWSVAVNTLLLVLISIWTTQKPLERLQSALFVDVFRDVAGSESRVFQRYAATKDLYVLVQRILGPAETHRLFDEFSGGNADLEALPPPDAAFIAHIERRLAGNIGAATARALVSQIATGESISLDEIINLVDETQQVVEYSHRLENQSQQLKETADKLQSANQRLQLLDRNKDEFLSQISHEVRTPMTAIRSFAEILLESTDLDQSDSKRFVNIIHEESIRLTRLLDEILEMSRLEQGDLTIARVPVAPETVLDRALNMVRGTADKQGIQIETGERVTDVTVMADADRLYQVFINLLSNSFKYNTNSSPVVTISSRLENSRYRVYIRDNGPGVSQSDHIFEKFARGRKHVNNAQSGVGLGLPISRQIIQRLEGKLELIDTHGKGACFRVDLPLAPMPTSS